MTWKVTFYRKSRGYLKETNQQSNLQKGAQTVLLALLVKGVLCWTEKCHFELCSFELEKKEKELTAALEDLQTEHLKETDLRSLFEEQQLQHKKAEDEKTKALEVMLCISVLLFPTLGAWSELTGYFCSLFHILCLIIPNFYWMFVFTELKLLVILLNCTYRNN